MAMQMAIPCDGMVFTSVYCTMSLNMFPMGLDVPLLWESGGELGGCGKKEVREGEHTHTL